jgi:hypothetical protein
MSCSNTRHPRFAANGQEVHAKAASGCPARWSALVNVSEQSRQGHHRLRFLVAVTATFRSLYVFVVDPSCVAAVAARSMP